MGVGLKVVRGKCSVFCGSYKEKLGESTCLSLRAMSALRGGRRDTCQALKQIQALIGNSMLVAPVYRKGPLGPSF